MRNSESWRSLAQPFTESLPDLQAKRSATPPTYPSPPCFPTDALEDSHLSSTTEALHSSDDDYDGSTSNPVSEPIHQSEKLSIQEVRLLLTTFERNPSPNSNELVQLSMETGIERERLYVWFHNRRSRRLRHHPNESASNVQGSTTGKVPLENSGESTMTPLLFHDSSSHLGSSLPSSSRPIGTKDEPPTSVPSSPSYSESLFSEGSPGPVSNPTTQSSDSSNGSASSSDFGYKSQRGFGIDPPASRLSQQGFGAAPLVSQLSCSPLFKCTFCSEPFRSESQWRLHETLHVRYEVWTCQLYPCTGSPEQDRTYRTKHSFAQHTAYAHYGVTIEDDAIGTLTENLAPEHPALQCGFCLNKLPNWNARLEHVAQHYRRGEDTGRRQPTNLIDTMDYTRNPDSSSVG